jgi:hypothetical protein
MKYENDMRDGRRGDVCVYQKMKEGGVYMNKIFTGLNL